ncbi:MAG TPA: hypothetical protein VFG03_06415, partial [Telluria sp.]|nr:hypothetical protein [Telluria sp.]
MFPRFLLALAASALLCGAAAPASHGVAIELLPEVVLDQPHIALADVAYVHAEQADSAALAHVDLGSVPRVGYVERFDRAQLETAIRQQTGMRAPALHWSGAAAVAVRTKTHPMLAQALVDAALAAVNAEFTRRHLHAEASVTTPPGDIELPAGDWQLRARSLHDTAVGARLPVWIDVLVDGTPYR